MLTDAEEALVARTVLGAVDEVVTRGAFLSTVLERALKSVPDALREAVVLRCRAFVRRWRALAELMPTGSPGDRYAGLLALEGLGPTKRSLEAAFAKWLAVEAPVVRVARHAGLPDWLAARLVEQYGAADALALATALDRDAPTCVRANRLLTTRESLCVALAEFGPQPMALATDGLVLTGGVGVFQSAPFQRGEFEVQDEGSQLVAELVAPPPKGLVLDLCAGSGGKSLALAALLKGKGRVVATDVAEHKLDELRRRARRAQAGNVQILPYAEAEALIPKADRVLLDAPCSGTGALRRNPEARHHLKASDLARFATAQAELLARTVSALRPGGRVVYATCSVLREENEDVVATVAGVDVVPPKELWGRARATALTSSDGRFLQLLPHRHGTDGFFAAVLRRRA